MKKIIFSFAVLAFMISTAFTGSTVCDGNDYFVTGVKSKVGYYSADGKLTATGTSEVTKVYTSGDSTIAILNSVYESADKKEPHASEMRLACVNGALVMDMNSGAMASQKQQTGRDIKTVCTGNKISYKQSYTVGEKLDSVNMMIESYVDGTLTATTTYVIKDRVVESYANLTVPAGTFKCYKISYNSSSTMKMKSMSIPVQKPHKSVMYYCPKTGMVRMEDYQDDKLVSYNELLSLTKP